MSRLRHALIEPQGGWAELPWAEDPVTDSFVRAANSVAALFARALAARDLESPAWWIRLHGGHDPSLDGVEVRVQVDRPDGYELGHYWLPSAVGDLSAFDQARLAADILRAAMTRLAPDRGWDPAEIDACHREVVETPDLTYHVFGAWKSSPDRRHKARVHYWLSPSTGDGWGRAVIEVQRRDGTPAATSAEVVATYDFWMFAKHDLKVLRWASSSVVTWMPALVSWGRAAGVGLELSDDDWRSNVVDPLAPVLAHLVARATGTLTRLPDVRVQGRGVGAPEQRPEMIFAGGGPTNHVPEGWLDELRRQLRHFVAPEGQDWWQDAGLRQLMITYYSEADLPKPSVRLWSNELRMTATIERPPALMHDPTPGAVARDDVRALVTAVRRRTGLGPHPLLEG